MGRIPVPTRSQCKILQGCYEGKTLEDFAQPGTPAGMISVTLISLQRRGWLDQGKLTDSGLVALAECRRYRDDTPP